MSNKSISNDNAKGGLTHCNSLFSPFLCLFSDPDDYIKSIPMSYLYQRSSGNALLG